VTTTTETTAGAEAAAVSAPDAEVEVGDELVAEDEVLLEEISIDGMCGVY
jgi:mycofactocin precursor